ncbi:MAG TPA: FecR domain-containing protein [Polyangiaceae bacterium]|jgi:TolA-binding protein
MTDPRPPSFHDIVPLARPSADEAVNRLVELARETSQDTAPAQPHALNRLERAIALGDAEPADKVRRLGKLGWWLLPAAAAAAGALWLHRDHAMTFQVVSGKVGDGGYVSSGPADATVTFSDRSDLGLAPGTRLRISDLEVRGARVMLEGGLLHVRINPETHGHWTLDAGPYIVHVTGTEFDLAWRVEEQTMDLRLERGSVTVEGPLADGGVKVGRGQHLIASASAGTLSLVDESNPAPAHAEAPVVVTPPAPASPGGGGLAEAPSPTVAVKSNATHKFPTRSDEPSWRARLAHGDFEGVLDDATHRGLDKVFAEASASDLAALADAARYARRSDLARRALIAERAHFPDSLEARDAPFFLGTLAQSEKNDASELEWYEVYLRESPTGAYAAEALGRQMMILQRVRGAEAARPLASEYIGRFGDGAYAPSARRLLQSQ